MLLNKIINISTYICARRRGTRTRDAQCHRANMGRLIPIAEVLAASSSSLVQSCCGSACYGCTSGSELGSWVGSGVVCACVGSGSSPAFGTAAGSCCAGASSSARIFSCICFSAGLSAHCVSAPNHLYSYNTNNVYVGSAVRL